MSTTPSIKVAKMIWSKAGFRCSMPDCRVPLYFAKTEVDDHSLVGEMAHIVGEKPGSARWEGSLPQDKRNEYDNLLLLCAHHHGIIDTQPGKYTVEVLKEIKASHTQWVDEALSAALNQEPVGRPSLSLTIASPIGADRIIVDGPPSEEAELTELIASAIVALEPITPRSEIEQMPQYRSGVRSMFDFGSGPFNQRYGLYDADIAAYEREYEGFARQVSKWARSFVALGRKRGPLIAVDIAISNFGNLAAGSVQVEAALTEGWHFMSSEYLEEVCHVGISPIELFSRSPFDFKLDRSPRRSDVFHQIGEPEEDLSSSEIVWHCQELRQNKEHVLKAIVVQTDPSVQRAVLSLSATSATITQSGNLELEIEASNRSADNFATYVRDRLALVPVKYHRGIMAALSAG